MSHQIVLVLDDYQFVTGEDSHESLAYFVKHLPENVHLVISSRSDPPLPLGRLRARGEMNEIRTEQLAFSEEEAACLLNEQMSLTSALMTSPYCSSVPKVALRLYLASLTLHNSDKHLHRHVQ